MDISVQHIQACRDAALSCEKCIIALSAQKVINTLHLRSFKQCADICHVLQESAIQRSIYIEKITVCCIGLCEECADICEELNPDRTFTEAIRDYRKCSHLLSELVSDTGIKISNLIYR